MTPRNIHWGVPEDYLQLNDWGYSVALARKYGVKVYPSLDESRLKNESAVARRMIDAAFRGRAANVWAAGADGVYLFNMFDPRRPLWRELGDPAVLTQLDRDYFASIRGVGISAGGNLPHQADQKVETLNPTAPRQVAPGAVASARLRLGETPTAGDPVRLNLRLQFRGAVDPAQLTVSVNGVRLPASTAFGAGDWLEFLPAPTTLRRGGNKVTVALAAGARKPVVWLDLMLEVRRAARR